MLGSDMLRAPWYNQAAANQSTNRDSEASAPAEFPPEQPEADLAADDDEYGAEEVEEEEEVEAEAETVEGVAEANGEPAPGQDAEMGGVENGAEQEVEEDEMSD